MNPNLFAQIPTNLPTELLDVLAESSTVKIERIVSRGHITPADGWYDQAWHEWVILLQGAARLEFAGDAEVLVLNPGDYRLIKAHQRHRVTYTAPATDTVWLAVHFQPDDTNMRSTHDCGMMRTSP